MFFDVQIKNTNRATIKANTADAHNEYNAQVKELYENNETVTPEMLSEICIDKKQHFIERYCVIDENGYAKISSERIDERVRFDGIMVLLSNSEFDPKKAFFAYNRRRTVEGNFQVFKDHLNFDRVYSSSDRSFQGKFLCQLIAASLMMLLTPRIRDYENSARARKEKIRLSDISLSRLLDELNTIMLIIYKSGYYFDEIIGKYQTLLNAIDIPVPEAKNKYEPDRDDMVSDEDLNLNYEVKSNDLKCSYEEQL